MIDRQRALERAHPESVIRVPDGRLVELKVHRATWSGDHPENSLAGLRECYTVRVARVEIDFRLRDGEFIVAHDRPRKGQRSPHLREALDVVRAAPSGPTMLMLDAKDEAPWSGREVESFVRLCDDVRDRIFVGSPADWNLRRLRKVEGDLPIAFDPQYYLTWDRRVHAVPGRRGAYGYQDAHPLALRRTMPTARYLRERFEMLLGAVPRIREIHLQFGFFERMLQDDFDVTGFAHDAGVRVDTWTLDAGSHRWRTHLATVIAGGVDVVTTNTAREVARATSQAISVRSTNRPQSR